MENGGVVGEVNRLVGKLMDPPGASRVAGISSSQS